MSNTYQCDACLGIFEKGWTDEEAIKEKDIDFPDYALKDCGVVCEDCYKELYPEKGVVCQ